MQGHGIATTEVQHRKAILVVARGLLQIIVAINGGAIQVFQDLNDILTPLIKVQHRILTTTSTDHYHITGIVITHINDIIPSIRADCVRTAACINNVITRIPCYCVIASTPPDRIDPTTAYDRIVTTLTINRISTITCINLIITIPTSYRVISVMPQENIIPPTASDCVITGTSPKSIYSTTTRYGVIAIVTISYVRTIPSENNVIPISTINRIIAIMPI